MSRCLAALRELVRGFEHADRIANGAILQRLRREHLQEVYIGLVTVLMRSVFVLFAEERGLLPMERFLREFDSLSRLYAQLVEDHSRFGEGLRGACAIFAKPSSYGSKSPRKMPAPKPVAKPAPSPK